MDVALPPHARAWLTLARVPRLGPRSLRGLLGRFPDPRALLAATPAELHRRGLPAALHDHLRSVDRAAVDADLAWLEHPGRGLLTLACADYPATLQACPDAPPLLFLAGRRELLARPCLAIVGSRNPTAGGAALARQFARDLAAAGLAIVSGLATGIDGAAHAGALAAGGATLAVTGHGLDHVYPACHAQLAARIARDGLLLSEFAPGTRPARGHFPRRNRVISGLSLGVLVVEAAPRSGSLITARLAAEQGREVFAIPGSIHNPLARGCHALLRDGAKLVEEVADVLAELPPLAAPASPVVAAAADPREPPAALDRQLLEQLRAGAASIDALVATTALDAATVAARLLALELSGHVSSDPGGR
ncbi:MAG TPA: DNA-processing protein DprA, partial [Gammaproteobacteria bacterium]